MGRKPFANMGRLLMIDTSSSTSSFAMNSLCLGIRASTEEECYMGEPTTLVKDMWGGRVARIAAVSSVNVVYTYEEAMKIKERRGSVSDDLIVDFKLVL